MKQKTIILLINNLEKEDFLPLITYTKFQKNLLVIFDKRSTTDHDSCPIDYLVEDFTSPETVLSHIETWKAKHQNDIVGIIGLDEEYKYTLSKKIADVFHLLFYTQDTINKISNKYIQLLELQKNNISVPHFEIISSTKEIKDITFPNITKPAYGIGSSFVSINTNEEQLKKNITYFEEKKTQPNNQLILEEFIGGDEYSCDFMVDNNNNAQVLRVVKKIMYTESFPFFEGFYLFNPDQTKQSPFTKIQLEQVCSNIASTFAIDRGVCMMDFKFFNNNIFVIETTIRPGISQFMELMGQLYGYISMDLLIKQILKEPANNKIPTIEGLVFYITTDTPGILKKFDTSAIEKQKEIVKIKKYYQPGQYIALEKDKCYKKTAIGHVMVKNVAPENIKKTITQIRKNIIIEIER